MRYCARCEVVARTCVRRYILTVESGTTLLTADQTTGEVALGPDLALPAGPPRRTVLNHSTRRDLRKTRDMTPSMNEVNREGAIRAQGAQDLHRALRLHAVAQPLPAHPSSGIQAALPMVRLRSLCTTKRERWFRTTHAIPRRLWYAATRLATIRRQTRLPWWFANVVVR